MDNNYLIIGIIAIVAFLYMCRSKEGFIPIWSATRHDGFNVYDNAAMRGGRVYSHLSGIEHGACRDSCKKRWTTDYKKCSAYNYNSATKDCDLIEYGGQYGGGIVPGEESDSYGASNYNNPMMSHMYSFKQ